MKCRICGGPLVDTTVDCVFECVNCGQKRDVSDPDELEMSDET